jgi:hypothetical protein
MRWLKALVGITILFIDVRFHLGIGNLAGPVMREYVCTIMTLAAAG